MEEVTTLSLFIPYRTPGYGPAFPKPCAVQALNRLVHFAYIAAPVKLISSPEQRIYYLLRVS